MADLESAGDYSLVRGKLSNRAILRDILTWAKHFLYLNCPERS